MSGAACQQVLHFEHQVVNAMHALEQVVQMVSFNSVSSHVSFTAKLLFLYLEKYFRQLPYQLLHLNDVIFHDFLFGNNAYQTCLSHG